MYTHDTSVNLWACRSMVSPLPYRPWWKRVMFKATGCAIGGEPVRAVQNTEFSLPEIVVRWSTFAEPAYMCIASPRHEHVTVASNNVLKLLAPSNDNRAEYPG